MTQLVSFDIVLETFSLQNGLLRTSWKGRSMVYCDFEGNSYFFIVFQLCVCFFSSSICLVAFFVFLYFLYMAFFAPFFSAMWKFGV